MKNAIYWNALWLNITEYGGQKSNLSEDIKVKFYDLIENVIVKKGECFLTSEDLESELLKKDSKYAQRHYYEAKHGKRYALAFFCSKHNLYEYNQEIAISLEDIDESEYMFIALLYFSFNYKSIIDVEGWFESHNSMLNFGKNKSSKFKEFLNAMMNYKELFSEAMYNGVIRQLGGNYLLSSDIYNTNIQVEQNNLALIQNNTVELTEEYHNYSETVQNFHPDKETDIKLKVINLNEYIPLNHEWLFKESLKRLRELSFIDIKNKWLLKPLDLVAYFGIIRSLGWCVSIGKNEVKTKAEFGEFLSEYFRVSNKTLKGYMKDEDIENAIVKKGKLFESVFNQRNWKSLKKEYPLLFK